MNMVVAVDMGRCLAEDRDKALILTRQLAGYLGQIQLSRREALIDLDGAVPENVLPEKQPRRERSDRPRGARPRRDRNDRH